MNLRDEWIESGNAELQLLDGRVLEVFRDRRANQGHARVGHDARRRKPPAVMQAHLNTGRIWVARGWAAVIALEARHFPRSQGMVFCPEGLGEWHITSLRANAPLTETLDFDGGVVFDFHALLLPSPAQIARLKQMGLVDLRVPAHLDPSEQSAHAQHLVHGW